MNTQAATLHHLMEVGRLLLAELDPEVVLNQVLDEARLVTGARYAAIGVLDPDQREIERFLTAGIDAETRRAMGEPPRGRGVLGVLTDEPQPVRLTNIGAHPQSFGFPHGHPSMTSFLGVPILIRGVTWANLYLTEKAFGLEFSRADEEAVGVLAQFAATAIDNARVYQEAERGRQRSLQAVRGLEAARTISDAIRTDVDLDTILELIVKRGRALVGARTMLILLAEGDHLRLVAGTGASRERVGAVVPVAGSVSGEVLRSGVLRRIDQVPLRPDSVHDEVGIVDARTALIVPMSDHAQAVGVLVALDRGREQEPFREEDEELMRTFASAAANAVVISRSVASDRLRATVAAAEEERRRWARELHDQTLQSLGGLRLMLSGARRRDDLDGFRHAVTQAVSDIESEIQNLRGIISDLRPSLLDDLGLADALGALVTRHRDAGIAATLEVALEAGDGTEAQLSAEMETAVYRMIQEALTNVAKHAQAGSVTVRVHLGDDARLLIEVVDDGIGFDPRSAGPGFGLSGIRERVYLAGGNLEIDSAPTGTRVRVTVPVGAPTPPSPSSASSPPLS